MMGNIVAIALLASVAAAASTTDPTAGSIP
jgi:hypothetical protein